MMKLKHDQPAGIDYDQERNFDMTKSRMASRGLAGRKTKYSGWPKNNDPYASEKEGVHNDIKGIVARLEPILPPSVERPLDIQYIENSCRLIQAHVKNQAEMIQQMALLLADYPDYSPVDLWIQGIEPQMTCVTYAEIMKLMENPDYEFESFEKEIDQLAGDLGIEPARLKASLRMAITGRNSTLPIFLIFELLGQNRVRERVFDALRCLTLFGK
jgi:hypothetical protein